LLVISQASIAINGFGSGERSRTDAFPSAPGLVAEVPFHVTQAPSDTAYVAEPRRRYALHPWLGHFDIYGAERVLGLRGARLARAHYEAFTDAYAEARAVAEGIRQFDPHIRPEQVGPLRSDRLDSARCARFLSPSGPDFAAR